MKRSRRLAAAIALAAAGSAGVVGLLGAPAAAQAPDIAAWWNAANVGNGAPAPPAPPDVPSGDLLVQGSNAVATALPIGGAPASSSAVAGMIFDLPDNATVGALTLQIDGSPPASGVSIVACHATQSFSSEENGAWSDVPPSDCSQTSAAKLDGSTLTFDDVSKLVKDNQLAIVLLPGSVDRVVLKKPDANALSVTTLSGLGPAAAPFGTGTNAGPQPVAGSTPVQPVAPVGGGSVLPPAGTGTAVAPPVIAPPTTATGPATNQAAASSAAPGTGGLSTTQRRVLAAVVIAAELLGFLLLLGDRDVERLALGSAVPALAGGRLRPPDRVARAGDTDPVLGGVGRFRAARSGRPPRL